MGETKLLDRLKPRELELAKAVAQGHSNKEIAAQLGLAENTVKQYISHIFFKLDISNRMQLALLVVAEGK